MTAQMEYSHLETIKHCQIVGLGVLRGGQSALGLGTVGAADLDAGVLPQTELGGSRKEILKKAKEEAERLLQESNAKIENSTFLP